MTLEAPVGGALSDANARARDIVAEAELDGVHIIEQARAQAYFETTRIHEEDRKPVRTPMLRVPATTTPIHSSEIALREFPRALHGFDREAVSKWLALVEESFTLLEDELERRRHDIEGLVTGLAEMRRHLARASVAGAAARVDEGMMRARVSWNQVVATAAATVPSNRLAFDTLLVRTALMETPLRRKFSGYDKAQVRSLLETSAAQLARLENQLHLAHAENDRLVSLFLEQIAQPDG
jgi:cell division septum initiation protein DivIVA